jgi:hypothetical protein
MTSMDFARIEGGAVMEIRDLDLDVIPVHKRQLWRPIEGDKPVCSDLETIVGPTLVTNRIAWFGPGPSPASRSCP